MTFNIKDPVLLKTAFTHRSFLNESDGTVTESNERLEYLGDAVLELAVSEYLYHQFPQKPEGELTALRAALVKTTTLAKAATKLGFGERLFMSKGEVQTGGRTNPGLLANTFEAVIGAIYLDSDYQAVIKFLTSQLFIYLPEIIDKNLHRDYKSSFQERVQADGHPTPTYQLLDQQGPDHDKMFTVALMVGARQIAVGTGRSKQQAQQEAAKNGLEQLDQGLNL